MADSNYLTRIAIPKEAAQWLRERANRYKLGLAGLVRILLTDFLDSGWEPPETFDWAEHETDSIQIGVPLELVRRLGGDDVELAKEVTRQACRHVIQIAYERSCETNNPAFFFSPSTLSSSAA